MRPLIFLYPKRMSMIKVFASPTQTNLWEARSRAASRRGPCRWSYAAPCARLTERNRRRITPNEAQFLPTLTFLFTLALAKSLPQALLRHKKRLSG
jgi:hypothetical protein